MLSSATGCVLEPPTMSLFPANYSILVTGPPGVGKLEWLLRLMKDSLTSGKRVVFVALDLHPNEIRTRAKEMGVDLSNHEGRSLVFVDCYSAMASERPDQDPRKRVIHVSSPSNLEGIGMAVTKAADELKVPVVIFFYSVSTLFLHNSQQAIAKFMQIVTSRVKTNLGFIAYAVHEGVHEPMVMNLLKSLVDGVVEARFIENEASDVSNEIRIHHARGMKTNTSWWQLNQVTGLMVARTRDNIQLRG